MASRVSFAYRVEWQFASASSVTLTKRDFSRPPSLSRHYGAPQRLRTFSQRLGKRAYALWWISSHPPLQKSEQHISQRCDILYPSQKLFMGPRVDVEGQTYTAYALNGTSPEMRRSVGIFHSFTFQRLTHNRNL